MQHGQACRQKTGVAARDNVDMTVEEEERVCCCALNMLFGFEPRISHAIIDTLGSASAVFGLDRAGLDEIFGPYSKYRHRICRASVDSAAEELENTYRAGGSFIGYTDRHFPALLKECPDAPSGLYYRSSLPVERIFGDRICAGVVGTRDVSEYGKEWTGRIVSAMAACGASPVVVSGLAYGVDVAAHRSALAGSLDTVAVMATGIDSVYPWRHRQVAEDICCHGALVSDFPLGTSPLKVNFLRRNRIIAGLCRSIVLVESRIRGGGMVTAGLAFSYGREVYALPGRADDPRSQGCNWLIRTGRAETVFSAEDYVRSCGMGTVCRKRPVGPDEDMKMTYAGRASEENINGMSRILSVVRGHRGITLDDLCAESGLTWSQMMEYVGHLEADGFLHVDFLQRCSIAR